MLPPPMGHESKKWRMKGTLMCLFVFVLVVAKSLIINLRLSLFDEKFLRYRRTKTRRLAQERQSNELLCTTAVEAALEEVRPFLQRDGGNVSLHHIDGTVVYVKLKGACLGCPQASATLKNGIEKKLIERIPAISSVQQVPREPLEVNASSVEEFLASIRPALKRANCTVDLVSINTNSADSKTKEVKLKATGIIAHLISEKVALMNRLQSFLLTPVTVLWQDEEDAPAEV